MDRWGSAQQKPNTVTTLSLERLSRQLGHGFTQPALLRQALTHRSHGATHNERLEFVGDSILNYTVARMLFEHFPQAAEGELSRLRANLVNQVTLAEIARSLDLRTSLFLGEGELRNGGCDRASILADALEALFAAVCLDADFATAEAVVRRLYQSPIAAINLQQPAKSAKTRPQEALQGRRLPLPKYLIAAQSGEAHEQTFQVSCDIASLNIRTTGQGRSRRAAVQQAAAAALSQMAALPPNRKKRAYRRPASHCP